MRLARSLLYVPGDRADRLFGALGRGADLVIADLEDAVPPGGKDAALKTVAAWLDDLAPVERARVVIRVNAGDRMEHEAVTVVRHGATALSLPKASAVALEMLDRSLGGAAADVIALIETARGVLGAEAIARAPRVTRLAIGEADLAAELRVEASDDGRELWAARGHIVLASAAAGLQPPVGPVTTDFRDLDALRVSSEALRRAGFGGRATIHPAQVPVVNDAFTPDAEAVAKARRIVEIFEKAGRGVCVDDEGRMIDEAIVRSARITLAAADEPPVE